MFAKADKAGALTDDQRNEFLGEALRGLTRSYANDPPPATFRVLVSPMVTWIWLGALVVFLGGLIALWPSPRAVGRRVTAAYAARVGREARVPALDGLLVIFVVPAGGGVVRVRAAALAAADEAGESAERAELEAARTRSTARSGTPSSTTGPASCPRPTGARWTAGCAPRRSRSSGARRTPTRPPRRVPTVVPWTPMLQSVLSVVQVFIAVDPDLPGAPALGEGRRHVGRVRRRHRGRRSAAAR